MANTYTWSIDSLDCISTKDGKSNVVSDQGTVITFNGKDIKVPYSAHTYGVKSLVYTEGGPFIEYDSLTKDKVIDWLKNAIGNEEIQSIENNLNIEIENLINPPVITLPLPWVV